MPDPIRIAELRAAAEARPYDDETEGHVCMTGTLLAALLDVAEAANALTDKLHIIAADGKRRRNVDRLRDALARLDFTPT